MDLVDRLASTGFLGREFLTWLWYRSDLQEGLFNLGEDSVVELFLTDRIALAAAGQGAEKVAVKAEDPGLTPEARVALRQGKKVEKACVRIVRGQREWVANVAGDSLGVSGAKIPALLTREEDEKLRERLALLDELDAMLTQLFRAFLDVRMAPEAWETERRAMQAWIHDEGPAAEPVAESPA